jgi:Flp pilus assembly protein TadD
MGFPSAYWVLAGLAVLGIAATARASIDSTRVMIAEGDLNQALESLEGLGDGDAETLFLRGMVPAELGRDMEAEKVFRDLIERYPDHPEPYNNLAVLLAGAGRFEEAVATLKDALRTHPSYRTAWDNLTTICGRLASEAYSRALDVDSQSQAEPVKLALLSTLPGADAPAMTPRVPTSLSTMASPASCTMITAWPPTTR